MPGNSTINFMQFLFWALYNECKTIGFMDGLGNNGFTNPIISSCLEISSIYNPFSSRFLFPVIFHHCTVYRFNSLHDIPPLLPPSDHACV